MLILHPRQKRARQHAVTAAKGTDEAARIGEAAERRCGLQRMPGAEQPHRMLQQAVGDKPPPEAVCLRSDLTDGAAAYRRVRIDAKPEIVFETPVSAVIDGHAGMGQLIAAFAMNKAIEKAKAAGMAFVTVRNSNHFGIAGYYTKMALDAGMMSIDATNSESIMVYTGSRQAVLGSNPIAFAAPTEPVPFWFDAATTVVPNGKLEVYRKADKPLCDGWAVDETGAVSTDAERVFHCIDGKVGAGGILPVGGAAEESGSHKGCGYSMICELLCAITSGGATSNHHVREGIEVDISTVAEIMEICRTLGMDSRDYLGDVDVAGAKKSVY